MLDNSESEKIEDVKVESDLNKSESTEEIVNLEEIKSSQFTPKNDAEKEALSKGWQPKELFKGDPDEWKPAKAFLKDGELFSFISKQNKKIKEFEDSLSKLSEHNKKIEEHTKQQVIAELSAKQRAAAEIGDVNAVAEITQKIVENTVPVKEELNSEQAKNIEIKEAYSSFLERNSWYDLTDTANAPLVKYAEEIDRRISARHPGISPAEHFELLEKHVKDAFKDRFSTRVISPVESGGDAPTKLKGEVSFNDLPKHHREQYMRFKNTLGDKFDGKNYIKQLKQIGEI